MIQKCGIKFVDLRRRFQENEVQTCLRISCTRMINFHIYFPRLEKRTKRPMNKFHSTFSTYCHAWNNLRSMIYFCLVGNQPSSSLRFSNSIFSKTGRDTKKWYSTFSICFCSQNLFIANCMDRNILAHPVQERDLKRETQGEEAVLDRLLARTNSSTNQRNFS